MSDPERAAVSRYKIESQGLLRAHRGLSLRLELVERALERYSDPAHQEELRGERARITELLADSQARLRVCWDQSRSRARRAARRSE